jgi:hypothetical protein
MGGCGTSGFIGYCNGYSKKKQVGLTHPKCTCRSLLVDQNSPVLAIQLVESASTSKQPKPDSDGKTGVSAKAVGRR